MRLNISKATKIGGVSVRTLRYYDEIELIHPAEVSSAGYRYYDVEALRALAQVRFYRELGLPILSGLADMYITAARFTANLDRYGAGTAQCMYDALKAYCASQGCDV